MNYNIKTSIHPSLRVLRNIIYYISFSVNFSLSPSPHPADILESPPMYYSNPRSSLAHYLVITISYAIISKRIYNLILYIQYSILVYVFSNVNFIQSPIFSTSSHLATLDMLVIGSPPTTTSSITPSQPSLPLNNHHPPSVSPPHHNHHYHHHHHHCHTITTTNITTITTTTPTPPLLPPPLLPAPPPLPPHPLLPAPPPLLPPPP